MKIYKKLILTFLLSMMTLILSSLSASALTEGDWEFTLLDNGVVITDYLGSDKDIVIPSKIYGTDVTKIEDLSDAIRKCGATSITLPSTVKETGVFGSTVWDNKTLETVYIPDGVETISSNAFHRCVNLKTIVLPSTVRNIGSAAMYSCKSLKDFAFGANLELIDENSFWYAGLKEADLSSCTLLDWERMKYTSVFFSNPNLTKVILPSNCTLLPDSFVQDCISFEEMDFNGAPIKRIGDNNFRDCGALKNLLLPTTLEEICYQACTETG